MTHANLSIQFVNTDCTTPKWGHSRVCEFGVGSRPWWINIDLLDCIQNGWLIKSCAMRIWRIRWVRGSCDMLAFHYIAPLPSIVTHGIVHMDTEFWLRLEVHNQEHRPGRIPRVSVRLPRPEVQIPRSRFSDLNTSSQHRSNYIS
jgi:hypothetical protein